jgi:hypothetical protein
MDYKDIYKLNLHESTWICADGSSVIRVPGGWIYRLWDYEARVTRDPVFVPFNNEFMEKE